MQSILIVLNSLTTLAAVVLAYSLINRYDLKNVSQKSIMGVIFGFCAILTLLQPLSISAGVQIDGRNLFIGFAGAMAGFVGAAIALGIAGFARIIIGGIGVWPGLVSMALCALAGLMWRELNYRRVFSRRWRWIVLGAMLSVSIPTLLLLPNPVGWLAFATGGPFHLIIYLGGSILLGTFLESERNFDMARRDQKRHAETDPLTGALNRRGFTEMFHYTVSSNAARSVVVIMLDLNNFKAINDKFGHKVGDQALISVATTIRANIRADDLFARLGGDEFAVCVFGITAEQSYELVSKLTDKLELELEPPDSDQTAKFSVSVGGSFFDGMDPDLDQLLATADREMMLKKHNSRHKPEPAYQREKAGNPDNSREGGEVA